MKFIKFNLALLAALALAFSASAQFTIGPNVKSAITNAGTWAIAPAAGGGVSTNVATTQANWVTIGESGYGVAIKSYATNAALTTNVWFILEHGVAMGSAIQPITNNNVTVVLLPRGVATNTYFTNFVTSSSATIGNVTAVRIKDVMQTNGLIGGSVAGTLFIENFVITTR